MNIVIASNNQHKVQEIAQILPATYTLSPQSEFNIGSVAETGLTFVENAILKARHACEQSGLPALADDSGLEVDALSGEPGIYSARYAGEGSSDAANNEKLLAAMTGQSNRAACFRCVIVLLRFPADPMPIIASGSWYGEILEAPRGSNGFGYDPLFYLPEYDCSVAELGESEKAPISHRGKALTELDRLLADQ